MTILVPTLSEKAKETVDAIMQKCVQRNEPIIFSSFYHRLNIRGLITNVSILEFLALLIIFYNLCIYFF